MIKGTVKINNHIFKGNKCFIELQYKDKSISGYTIIDKEDADRVLKKRWSLEKGKGYVRSCLNKKQVKLHNFILGVKGLDHINQNKLDNRKKNLRVATLSENNHNRPMMKNNTSGVKGVSQDSNTQRWNSMIRIRGVLYQKNCATKEQAIKYRKKMEKLL